MEQQIATGTHEGPGFDVPEQGLHLRRGDGDAWHGVLDTSMGPVSTVMGDMPIGDRVGKDEFVVDVPEQFVALTVDGDRMDGSIRTGDGDIPFTGMGRSTSSS